ncbi:MAG: FAD-dependent oxidoreductase, partial [Planctomycetota bacterium]
GYWWCEIGVPYHIIDDDEAIREEALRHLLGVWDHLKNQADHGADNLVLDWIGTVPGKRESRRLVGDYILRQADLFQRNRFDDAVAYGGWYIDIHTMGGILAAADGKPPEPMHGDADLSDDLRVPLYAIPFRCLYSKNIANLMMAGRNLSASHVALGSTRLMLTCALLGQAVGTAAALCLGRNASPRQLAKQHITDLQQQLLKDDCYIPGLRNTDAADRAIGAMAAATSEATLTLEPVAADADLAVDRAQIVPISERRVDTVSLLLRWRGQTDLDLEVELARVADIWAFNDPPAGDVLTATATVPGGHAGWVDFAFDAAVEPGLHCLRVPAREGMTWSRSTAMPGVAAAWKRPHWQRYVTERAVNAVRLSPASSPFAAESAVNGVNRTDTWPNLWISRPLGGAPQALTLDLGAEQTFDTVCLTFDTLLHHDHRAFPPFHRIAECVRDYAVAVEADGAWRTVVEEEGNYQRRRVHRFEAVTARRLRLVVRGTNGAPEARVYEVRVYQEG